MLRRWASGECFGRNERNEKISNPSKKYCSRAKNVFSDTFLLLLFYSLRSILTLDCSSFPKRDPFAGLKIALYFVSFTFSPCSIVYLFKALCKFCINHIHNTRSHNSVYSRSISSTIKGYFEHFQNYRFERASSFYLYYSTVNEIKFVENDREPGLWIYSTL